ncbi:hypothetical protein EDB19DRAFT_1829269 [Suillus lakei]|nr:hypothetical protein EDB19DRAFT_1829269 [Suillus lakei]
MSSPGASPRDLAPGLRLASMSSPSCTPPEFGSSPSSPPRSNRLCPLVFGRLQCRAQSAGFPHACVDRLLANRMSMSSYRTPSLAWMSFVAPSKAFVTFVLWILAAVTCGVFILEAPPPRGSAHSPYPSHKRSSSYHFPATGGGSPGRLRSGSFVHNPSTPDHRNSYSFSHTQSPRSQSSVFVSPATLIHNHSLPPSSSALLTPPCRVPFQASGSFVDRDCDEVDVASHVKDNVPGRPPRRWWNLTVPWNADEWWTPGDFVYQDEPRLKYDERLNLIRPTRLNLQTSDTTSDQTTRAQVLVYGSQTETKNELFRLV